MLQLSMLLHLFTPTLLLSVIIHFNNGSFEGEPSDATVPVGWLPCQPETTPDILPGVWGVTNEPAEGDTYVGLITRGDGSWESICQRLNAPIKADDCYQFTVDLGHATTYAGYTKPLQLKIWGGTLKCGKDQLLYTSRPVESEDWEKQAIQFTAEKTINYLQLEAYSEQKRGYRGNILIDNLSPLKPCARASAYPPAPYPSPNARLFQKAF